MSYDFDEADKADKALMYMTIAAGVLFLGLAAAIWWVMQ
jgi:hypothetical protein